MTACKSNGAYDTLISLRDKLTRLHGMITPEANDKLEDELARQDFLGHKNPPL